MENDESLDDYDILQRQTKRLQQIVPAKNLNLTRVTIS